MADKPFLPFLPRGIRIVDADGRPAAQFQVWWQNFVNSFKKLRSDTQGAGLEPEGGGGDTEAADNAELAVLASTVGVPPALHDLAVLASAATVQALHDLAEMVATIPGPKAVTWGSILGDFVTVDEDDTRVTIGEALTIPSGLDPVLYLPMVATKSVLIDGSTNNREVDSGVFRFLHTPAIVNARCITWVVNANGMTNTHATVVELTADGLGAGEQAVGHDVQLITGTSTGGFMTAFEVSKAGTGSAEARGMTTGSGVAPIVQNTGAFGAVEKAWSYNGAWTDVTAAFNSAASDVTLFAADNDVVYIGMAATFDSISVTLATGASNPGIKPDFEFSAGGSSWTAFSPTDDTAGFRNTGTIVWDVADLSGWATDTVNGVGSKYWVRITRTQNSLGTAPVEDTIQVQTSVRHHWDENGDVVINDLTAYGLTASRPVATDANKKLQSLSSQSPYAFIRLDANYALSSTTAAQKIFNTTTNGRLTIETGVYWLHAFIYISSMSATSGNADFDLLGSGTATLGGQLWQHIGRDAANLLAGTANSSGTNLANSHGASIMVAGTANRMNFSVHGMFKVTSAGTIVPSVALNDVTGAAGTVVEGSWLRLDRMADNGTNYVGSWD